MLLIREIIGKRVPAVGDPREAMAPGELPPREVRSQRRKCREDRDLSTWVRPDPCAGGPRSVIRPVHAHIAWKKEFSDRPFELPTRRHGRDLGMSGRQARQQRRDQRGNKNA